MLPTGGAEPILTGDGFWDSPFPADARLVGGHPDLTGFPGAGGVPIFEAYIALGATLDGWGTNSPIYVRFAAPPDMGAFPDPAGSLADDSPVLLLDIDPGSPQRGQAIPVVSELRETGDQYGATNLLAVAPLPGFPLRAATKYALVLTPPFAATGQMPTGWEDDPYWLELVQVLGARGLPSTQVAVATVFTTQDPVAELAKVAWQIQSGRLGRPVWEPELTLREEARSYLLYEGHVALPIGQEGERPYRQTGGGFVFDAFGRPLVQGWERVVFALTVPTDPMPEAGWPLVLYSHGTGGDHLTFASGSDAEGPAIANRGVAMFGVAQPLHGDRATPDTLPDLDTFNYANPAAGRTTFRQGAADQIWLAERLAETTSDFVYDGKAIRLNHDRLSFFGHSQGAMVGALGASWLSLRCNAVGLSEAGGGTAASALLKVDPFPIEPILAGFVGVEAGTLTTMHPVLALVQMLSEPTDPLNYASAWFAEAPSWPGTRPVAVLLTEGLEDTYTPPLTIESLATAAHLPVVGRMYAEPEGFDLRGLGADSRPAKGNVRGWDDSRVTAGLAQFPGQGHFAIYDDRDAKGLYKDFLESAAAGDPELPE